jgi:hypothetical protein
LVLGGTAWAFFALSALPLTGTEWQAGCYALAFVGSWVAAGSALWGSLRTGKRGWYLAALLSTPLAAIMGHFLWQITHLR